MNRNNSAPKNKNYLLSLCVALLWPTKKISHSMLRLLIKLANQTGFLRFARKVDKRYRTVIHTRMYNAWAVDNDKECFESDTIIDKQVLVSIVVPTYNTVNQHLLAMVYSVINQHYENWELILVNASDDATCKQAVKNCLDIDTRIKVAEVKRNLGISGNTNLGIDAAQGEYVAFLDHDDVLHPCALHSVVSKIINNNADFVYTDEDKITHDGSVYFAPHCKPKWSPDLLRNVNYINHLTVIKSEFVRQVGGLRPEFDGAQDFDLLLRIIDTCHPVIEHSPRVLYHWRASESSTASDISNKQYVITAGVRALQEHLDRNKQTATAEALPNRPGFYKVVHKYNLPISIIISPVSPRWQRACRAWINELLKVAAQNQVELIVGDWYVSPPMTRRVEIKTVTGKDYWASAAALVSNEVVICFQAAVMPNKPSDLLQLAAVAAQETCATVSPMIITKEHTILDAGLVESDFGLQPLFRGYSLTDSTPFGSAEWTRDVASPSLTVFASKKENFTKIIARHNHRHEAILHPNIIPQLAGNHIIWSYTPFTYKGSLHYPLGSNYFNPQLYLAQSIIHMRASLWEQLHERAEDE